MVQAQVGSALGSVAIVLGLLFLAATLAETLLEDKKKSVKQHRPGFVATSVVSSTGDVLVWGGRCPR